MSDTVLIFSKCRVAACGPEIGAAQSQRGGWVGAGAGLRSVAGRPRTQNDLSGLLDMVPENVERKYLAHP